MEFHEWMQSTGGIVWALGMVEEVGEDKAEELAANADPVAVEMFKRASDQYHAYICAHIAHLLEAKR
jgi:hypothetical protein